jgi:PAS domain S-box-containing protein
MNADFDPSRFSVTLAREAPDAIIFADARGRIRFWNRGAERIFGFSESEAVGQTLDIIIPENLRKRHWEGYMRTMQTGKTRYGAGDVLEVPALRKDGTRASVEFSMLPFQAGDGSITGIGVVLRDVTKRFEETKRLGERLEQLGIGLGRSSAWHGHEV